MVKILSANNPSFFFVAVVLSIGFHIIGWLNPCDINFLQQYKEPASSLIFSLLDIRNPITYPILLVGGFILQLLSAWIFNDIINEQKLSSKKSYLVATVFVIVSSLSNTWLILSPQLIVLFLLVLSLHRVFILSKQEKLVSPLFDIGFFYALAILFYFPSVLLFFFVLPALYSVRPFTIIEFLRVLLGFVTPFFAVAVLYFWNDQFTTLFQVLLNQENMSLVSTKLFTLPYTIITVVSLVWLLVSATLFSISPFSIPIKARKMVGMVILLSVFSILSYFVPTHFSTAFFIVLTPVISFYIGISLLEYKRDLIPNVIFALLFLTTVISLFLTT